MQGTSIAGRYTVERAVGRGGMGTVWLCRDEVLGRLVAVKQVGTLPGHTTTDVRRALREARSSAALDHPHVVRIFDVVEDGDRTWLVMEYVASRTLAEVVAEEGALSPERATWVGLQAAEGLAAAHARGTTHRDVKPSNILVADDDHVKITDFGIARTHGDVRLTGTGLVNGTPAYLPPEVARGEEADLPADVWALGATLYAAVEGNPPFAEHDNAIALLTSIASDPVPRPRGAGDLTEPILRMLDRDPASRWSMKDVVEALEHVHTQRLSGADSARPGDTMTLAVAPAPPPPTDPGRDPRRRARALLPAAVALLVVAVVAVVGALLVTRDDEPAPTAGSVTDSEPSTDAEPEPEPEPEPGPEPEQAPSPEPDQEPDQEPEPAAGPAEFGSAYYRLLPGDTASAYDLLAPSYGISFEAYDGFWRTIEAVTVRDVTTVDETTVDVDLTYVTGDGTSEDETRRLFLQPEGEGYRIVDDMAL